MGLLIGMDEAGYGPNLGPLVITATAWEISGDPARCNPWTLLKTVVQQRPAPTNGKLHVADSKQVYQPAKGLGSLETSALCLLRMAGITPGSFGGLWQSLAAGDDDDTGPEPWFADPDLPLPVAADPLHVNDVGCRLCECAETAGLRSAGLSSDIVLTRRFNRLTAEHDSKGHALSSLSLRLLRTLWDPDEAVPALVIADKHGGRNRYDGLLAEVLDGQMIFRLVEGRARSTYRVGRTQLRFETNAESHFCVAVASIVSKYVRELAMLAFNRFWQQHLPALKPTAGYPGDSRRFKQEIAAKQAELGIPDEILWRER